MKRKTAGILLLAVLLLMTGCSAGSDPQPEAPGAVVLHGDPYPYDLSEYVALREYRNIPYTPYGTLDRTTAEEGDTVACEIHVDAGETKDIISGVNTFVVGNSGFLDGFDEELVGHEVDEEITMDLFFPDEPDVYGVYAGTPAHVTAYILILDMSHVRETNEDALWQIVVDESEVLQYPEKELAAYQADYRECYETFAAHYDMTLEKYLKNFFHIEPDGLDDLCLENAKEQIREEMIAYAIFREAGLALTESDLDNTKQLWLESFGYEDESEMPSDWTDETVLESLEKLALERKVKRFLYDSASPNQ